MKQFINWIVDDYIINMLDGAYNINAESLRTLVERKVHQMGYFEAVPKAVVTLTVEAFSGPDDSTRVMKPFNQLSDYEQQEFLASFEVSKDNFNSDEGCKIINYSAKIELEYSSNEKTKSRQG